MGNVFSAPKPINPANCNAAFVSGNFREFKRQIEGGVDPNLKRIDPKLELRRYDGHKGPATFLQRAVLLNKIEFVKYLIQHEKTNIFVKISEKNTLLNVM